MNSPGILRFGIGFVFLCGSSGLRPAMAQTSLSNCCSVRLYSGDSLCGQLVERKDGKLLVLLLPSGERKAIDWTEFDPRAMKNQIACETNATPTGSLPSNGVQPEPQETSSGNSPPSAPPTPSPNVPRLAPARQSEPPLDTPESTSFSGIRNWGIGTAFGAGFSAGPRSTPSLALGLPSLEVQSFTRRGHSIDISLPIFNMLYVLGLSGGKVVVLGVDFFYNFNLGSGRVRFLVGPGLGLAAGIVGDVGVFALRIPAEVGVEFLTKKRGFGFKILARPWAEVGYAGNIAGAVFGGGLMGALGLSWYKTGPWTD